jgi:hypothetical protein
MVSIKFPIWFSKLSYVKCTFLFTESCFKIHFISSSCKTFLHGKRKKKNSENIVLTMLELLKCPKKKMFSEKTLILYRIRGL